MNLSKKYLKTIFIYKSGQLFWKTNGGGRICNKNRVAGTLSRSGYIIVSINKKRYRVHRVIYQLFYGNLKELDFIDHKDCDKSNNDIGNLRKCSRNQNYWNTKKRKSNKSGYKGVCWKPSKNKFIVQIMKNRKYYFLGYFNDIEKANNVYKKAAKVLHGRFAPL